MSKPYGFSGPYIHSCSDTHEGAGGGAGERCKVGWGALALAARRAA